MSLSKSQWIIVGIVGFLGLSLFSCCFLGMIAAILDPTDHSPSKRNESVRNPPKQEVEDQPKVEEPIMVMVRIKILDDTKNDPIPDRAEIWFRGYGSCWFSQKVIAGYGEVDLGKRASGFIHTGDESIQFYPDGRDGKEINIPLKMTKEMNPDGSDRDAIWVEFFDDRIEVAGLPIKEATGKGTMSIPR